MIYTPAEDSYLLAEELKKIARGKVVLDIGSGSGIISETALKAGAKSVLASDINKESVVYLKTKNIPVVQSDLFSKIKGRFDIIAFNPPYLPQDKLEDKESQLTTTGGKKGDEIILKFLKSAKSHLSKGGIILLLLSSLTPKARILKLLKQKSLRAETISKKKLFMEELEAWKLQPR